MLAKNIKILYIPAKYLSLLENVLILSKQIKIILHYKTKQTIENYLNNDPIALIVHNNKLLNFIPEIYNTIIVVLKPYKLAQEITLKHIYMKIGQIYNFPIPQSITTQLLKYTTIDGFHSALYYSLSKGRLPSKILINNNNVANIYVNKQLLNLYDKKQVIKYEYWNLFEKIGDSNISNYYKYINKI